VKTLSFSLSFFLIALIWAPEAAAHALSCTNPYKYVYYTEDAGVASKCKYAFDSDCVFKGTSANCMWQGSYKASAPAKPAQTAKPAPAPADSDIATKDKQPFPKMNLNLSINSGSGRGQSAGNQKSDDDSDQDETKKDDSSSSYDDLAKKDEPKDPLPDDPIKQKINDTALPAPKPVPVDDSAKIADIAQAKKEAKEAAAKVQELKATMEEIKVANQNNAILYRSPDANIGSVDPRFNAFSAGLSGEAENGGANSGLLSRAALFGKGSKDGKKGAKGLEGRGLASDGSGATDIAKASEATGASTKGEGSSATSDNPWVSYMDQTSKAGLIDRLRKNPSLRDSLRDRIAELQTQGDKSGIVELMEEALVSAEKESAGPNLDDLKPMGIMEAFSMDAGETEAQIRSLLADLDTESDPQFLPQTSLFERVSVAHRRSLVRGSVKSTR
jgi:hypothetical protein